MKIRNGFVSNSSSSSYTCDVCDFSAYSWERPDGFTYCTNGHALCRDCYEISDDIIKEMSELSVDELIDVLGISRKWDSDTVRELEYIKGTDDEIKWIRESVNYDELLPEFCPICRMEIIAERDMKKYLVKVSNISPEVVFQHIKSLNKRRKKLYDNEYISYVCGELGLNIIKITEEIKSKFKEYEEFVEFIK